MKFEINEIFNIYCDCSFVGLYPICDNEPCMIFVVSDNDKVIAIYESVWADDFATANYEMMNNYDDFGAKMVDVAEKYIDGGYEYRPL